MTIRTNKNLGFNSDYFDVASYVESKINQASLFEDGIAETASRTAFETANILARLIHTLERKGVLDLVDVSVIAAGFDEGLERLEDG